MLRVSQDPYKDRKKDLVQHGKCVLHKVLISYFFLGSQRMPNFALFTGLEDAESSQKHWYYSHSMVPMGLGVRSYRTRLMPSTSWVIRLVIWCSRA